MSGLLTLLAQGSLLDPGGGSGPTGELGVSPAALIAALGLGFLIGAAGHVFKSRAMVAFGVALIFGATFLVPVLLAITN